MPTTPSIQLVKPNLYQLSGENLHIVYSTTGIDGKPHFTYQDALQTHSFSGDQIRSIECDLGTVVSVTIRLTVDSGSTTFSVLIPRVNLTVGHSATIKTEGITTLHRFSILPILNQGQIDSYAVKSLTGTASQVVF